MSHDTLVAVLFMSAVAAFLAALVYSDARRGTLHCGQVYVTTPDGEQALEEKCWRVKR